MKPSLPMPERVARLNDPREKRRERDMLSVTGLAAWLVLVVAFSLGAALGTTLTTYRERSAIRLLRDENHQLRRNLDALRSAPKARKVCRVGNSGKLSCIMVTDIVQGSDKK